MLNTAASLVLFFTPIEGQMVRIEVERTIAELGRQEVSCTVLGSEGEPVACVGKYPSPTTETHDFVATSSEPHTLTIESMYDPTSVGVKIWIIPTLTIDRDNKLLKWKGVGHQLYTVEKNTDGTLNSWQTANPNRVEEPGRGPMEMEYRPNLRTKAFRLKVTR